METHAEGQGPQPASVTTAPEEAEELSARSGQDQDYMPEQDREGVEVRVDETLLEPTYGGGIQELLDESQDSGSGARSQAHSPGLLQQAS